jgi:hypothetical protein
MMWVMLIKKKGKFQRIKADGPCWKGEINIPLFSYTLTIGWQRKDKKHNVRTW